MFERLFNPDGVVVIGASRNTKKLGFGVAQNLITSKYQGAVYLVNRQEGTLFDHPFYSDLMDVPDPLDLAVIVIPARFVPETLEICGQRGIPFVIVSSSGFKETGAEGVDLERRCLEIAEQYGIRILGPNCIGILDTHLPLNTTFLPLPGPIQGEVALVSHSGAICAGAIDWTRNQGIGFSRLVSLGNQIDINETDLLQPIAMDDNTRVITLYLESIGDGPRFVKEAKSISAHKPIIALKVGRTERGQDAVASHTGALAGTEAAFDAAFERAGVLRAHRLEELFDWAKALAWCPLPKGRRVAILTNAGGLGVIATDALFNHGLIAADLEERTIQSLLEILPSEASVKNPIDMLASAGPEVYTSSLSALLNDKGVDSIMLILPPPPIIPAEYYADAIIPVVHASTKPVIITLMGDGQIRQASELFRQAKIPDYRFPEAAASALGVLSDRAEQLSIQPFSPLELDEVDQGYARSILEKGTIGEGGFLDPVSAYQIVSSYGIEISPILQASNSEEVARVGESIGYPVALKINSPDLPHKSEAGGVVLDLQDGDQLITAYRKMMSHMKDHFPNTKRESVLVQKMVKGGQEAIIGGLRDPQFGPLVMFGSGGIEVEGLKDYAFALAPLNRHEVEKLIDKTWAGRKLLGYRNIVPADREAVLDVILRIGQLISDFPQIVELEINPLCVQPKGGGAIAVDVRMKIVERIS